MAKLSEYLAKDTKTTGEDGNKKKAIIRLKLALLIKKMKSSKNAEIKSAFAEHLEGVK